MLATALNIHFKARGPEQWHFERTSAGARLPGSSEVVRSNFVREAVRRQGLPAWVDSLWCDLARTGQVKLAAALSLEGLRVSQIEPASGGIPTSGSSVSAQRSDEIEAEKQKQNPSELPGEFWRKLRIARGLPAHLKLKNKLL